MDNSPAVEGSQAKTRMSTQMQAHSPDKTDVCFVHPSLDCSWSQGCRFIGLEGFPLSPCVSTAISFVSFHAEQAHLRILERPSELSSRQK
jgi:hypothetical protein